MVPVWFSHTLILSNSNNSISTSHARSQTHARTHIHIHTHTRTHTHIRTYTHTHAHTHTYTRTHTHTYARTHTHTHTQAHTHTHTPGKSVHTVIRQHGRARVCHWLQSSACHVPDSINDCLSERVLFVIDTLSLPLLSVNRESNSGLRGCVSSVEIISNRSISRLW